MRSLNILALTLTASIAAVGTAYAADRDGFDVNQVVVAYADGYTGTDNQFHAWQHKADAQETRAEHLDRYRPWMHDDKHHANDTNYK
jgi:hypothetical protein